MLAVSYIRRWCNSWSDNCHGRHNSADIPLLVLMSQSTWSEVHYLMPQHSCTSMRTFPYVCCWNPDFSSSLLLTSQQSSACTQWNLHIWSAFPLIISLPRLSRHCKLVMFCPQGQCLLRTSKKCKQFFPRAGALFFVPLWIACSIPSFSFMLRGWCFGISLPYTAHLMYTIL